MPIENPSSIDEHALAALIYAEATVSHAGAPTPEMLFTAIAPATPGVSGTNPYVWFKQGRLAPSPRATPDSVHVGSHWFWSFASGRESG